MRTIIKHGLLRLLDREKTCVKKSDIIKKSLMYMAVINGV